MNPKKIQLNAVVCSNIAGRLEFTKMAKKRITKVYTKFGDKGETSLVGGEKVSKASFTLGSILVP